MKHLIFLFVITMSLTMNAQHYAGQSNKVKKDTVEETNNIGYSYTIIPAPDKTWGYDIYFRNRLIIHQPGKPGLPGNEGFNSKTDAKKVTGLVIEKLKKGEMFPAVTIEELKKLRVLQD